VEQPFQLTNGGNLFAFIGVLSFLKIKNGPHDLVPALHVLGQSLLGPGPKSKARSFSKANLKAP